MPNTYTDEDTYIEVINRLRVMRTEIVDARTAASFALNGNPLGPDRKLHTLVSSYESVAAAKKERDEMNDLYEANGWGRPFWISIGQREEIVRRVGLF